MYGFISLTTILLESGVWATTDSVMREKRITVPYKALKVAMGPLLGCDLRGLVANSRDLVVWMFVGSLVLYYCDVPEYEDMSAV